MVSQWKSDAAFFKRRYAELEEKLNHSKSIELKCEAVSQSKSDLLIAAVARSHYELANIKAGEMNTSSLQRVVGVVQGNLAIALSQCGYSEVPAINLYPDEENTKRTLDRVRGALDGR